MSWLIILGVLLLSWSLFQLGRWWERDHPEGEDESEVVFTPDSSWDWSLPQSNESRFFVTVRRGPYDWRNEP